MKNSHLFWGILFISLGFLVLLNNFTSFSLEWSTLWKMWPAVLVLWGLVLVAKNNVIKGVLAGLAAIILALTIFAAFKSTFSFVHDGFVFDINYNEDDYEVKSYSEPYDNSVKKVDFYLKGGAGKITINGTTGELFSAVSEGYRDNYLMSYNKYDSTASINFKMKKTKVHFNKNSQNNIELKLNSSPVWEMDYDIGAASVDFDLSPFKVEQLRMETGAASVKIRVGSLNENVDLRFHAGAARLEIEVPESSGCEIKTEAPLSVKDFDGFNKIRNGYYRSPGYSDSVNKIHIEIEAGISSIEINRYPDSEWESALLN